MPRSCCRYGRFALTSFLAGFVLALAGPGKPWIEGRAGEPGKAETVAARMVPTGVREEAAETEEVFTRPVPEGIEDLLAIQKRVQALVPRITEATVGIRIGRAHGSGVIVSEEGHVLTAAHVCRSPGRRATVILSDGRQLRAKTLGVYRTVDAGLVEILSSGQWPHVEMGDSTELKPGQWCIATGHPGGFREDRDAVVRLGRIIVNRRVIIQTDCPLIGGDSGGPLFDMDGKVIGINSRIGSSTNWNFHVPVSHYEKHWDRLAASEAWGGIPGRGEAVLGINGEDHEDGCRITGVSEGLPADRIGLQVGDVITEFDGENVDGIVDLAEKIGRMEPGQKVKIVILREGETIQLTVELAERE